MRERQRNDECKFAPGGPGPGLTEIAAEARNEERRSVVPHHGFWDRDGVYHPAPGCNVVLTGLASEDKP